MKVIIAGCRDFHDYDTVEQAVVDSGFKIERVISGGAPGVDTLAVQYAKEWIIPLEVYFADWGKHGKSAGPIRNRQMAGVADALIAIWDGHSRGTKNMIEEATKRGLKVYVKRIDHE